MNRCYFFGCWKQAGHFLHDESGRVNYHDDPFRDFPLDGGLAPKRNPRTGLIDCAMLHMGDFSSVFYTWPELLQGQFLRHVLCNGFTAIAWWDRCQSDSRSGCSSTFLLEGEHNSDQMLAALAERIPHVLENLSKHGVSLVEVQLGSVPQ